MKIRHVTGIAFKMDSYRLTYFTSTRQNMQIGTSTPYITVGTKMPNYIPNYILECSPFLTKS